MISLLIKHEVVCSAHPVVSRTSCPRFYVTVRSDAVRRFFKALTSSLQAHADLFCYAAYVFCCVAVFFGALEVLEHKRRIRHLAQLL